jgi:type IV secretory pathway TrbD component
MPQEPSLTARLSNETLNARTVEQVLLLRNICLSGAAATLVILTGLLQVSDKSSFAFISAVWLTSLSLPLWVLAGTTYEGYVLLGERSFQHLNLPLTRKLLIALSGTAGVALWGAVGSLVAVLSVSVFVAYVITSVLIIILGTRANNSLAIWWFSDDGPGSTPNG